MRFFSKTKSSLKKAFTLCFSLYVKAFLLFVFFISCATISTQEETENSAPQDEKQTKNDVLLQHSTVFFQDVQNDYDIKILTENSVQYNSSIEITTDKENANLYLDGELKGKTPTVLHNVFPGLHLISVEKRHFLTKNFQIRIPPYSKIKITIELQKDL